MRIIILIIIHYMGKEKKHKNRHKPYAYGVARVKIPIDRLSVSISLAQFATVLISSNDTCVNVIKFADTHFWQIWLLLLLVYSNGSGVDSTEPRTQEIWINAFRHT